MALFYYFTIILFYHITVLLYHCFTISLSYYFTIVLSYYFTILLYHCFSVYVLLFHYLLFDKNSSSTINQASISGMIFTQIENLLTCFNNAKAG